MRSREFIPERSRDITINIPIVIKLPRDDDDDDVVDIGAAADGPLPLNAVMVTPLQQSLELAKKENGKNSAVLDQLISDDGAQIQDDDDSEHDAPPVGIGYPANVPMPRRW